MNSNTTPQNVTGWICPKCGKVLSPDIKTCNCNLKEDSTDTGPQFLTEEDDDA
jgi:uncharacterized OB-fold protein